MSNLPALLAELATVAPEVCKIGTTPNGNYYQIDVYQFWFSQDELCASYQTTVEYGRPALAWLLDALQEVIEAKGWHYRLEKWSWGYSTVLRTPASKHFSANSETLAKATLTALIAALK